MQKKMKKIIIAIDGPAGSGKSTTAREAAKQLGYIYIDTGAMYRAVTLECIRRNIDISDNGIYPYLDHMNIELKPSDKGQMTFLNGEDVSSDIRLPKVNSLVSPVSALGVVREKLVDMQRQLGHNGGVVMDGRDIGTVVFPNAELKIYLEASIETRARRRALEFKAAGIDANEDEIIDTLISRDQYDSTRNISPLRKAADAVEIDTSELTIPGQTKIVIDLAMKIINDTNL
jgi:CMP/dCMP kinase